MVGTMAPGGCPLGAETLAGLRRRGGSRPRFALSRAANPHGGGRRHARAAEAPAGTLPTSPLLTTAPQLSFERTRTGVPTDTEHVQNEQQVTSPSPVVSRSPVSPTRRSHEDSAVSRSRRKRWLREPAWFRGPRARPQLRVATRAPSLRFLLRLEPEHPPSATAKGACGKTRTRGANRISTAGRRRHCVRHVLVCQGREVGGLEARPNPWISGCEDPMLQKYTTPQHLTIPLPFGTRLPGGRAGG